MAKCVLISMVFFVFGWNAVATPVTVGMEAMSATNGTKDSDVSNVTWAHAVNSREELEEYLSGDVDFLEADVSMGYLVGHEVGPPVPIMSHPPKNSSDITLERWVDIVITRDTGKGVKLDFKTIEAVEPTLAVLKKHERKVNFPLWLNADILAGPVNSTTTPVPPTTFLELCDRYFPNATLSLGWTTYFFDLFPPNAWQYSWHHVRSMADVLRCSGSVTTTRSLTFPVRAVFASRSIHQLQWLLEEFPESTLTVWSAKNDPVSVDDLLKIKKDFKVSDVYYDVPEPLLTSFHSIKDAHKPLQSSSLPAYNWLVFDHGSENAICTPHTYAQNRTVLFDRDHTSVALLNDVFEVADGKRLEVKGLLTFYTSSNGDMSRQGNAGIHELSLVLADANFFSKSSNYSSSDEAVWSAVNQSVLHVFQHDFDKAASSCRYFRLDTQSQKPFQAWSVPCDTFSTDIPVASIMEERRVPEATRGTKLVLPPGDVMFGMVSTGPGHVVVHEIDVRGVSPAAPSTASIVFASTLFTLINLIILAF